MKRRRRSQIEDTPRVEFISTGSHILNLAASGKGARGGWARGRIDNIVGDESTGKTFLALEACAQAYYAFINQKSRFINPMLFPPVKKLSIVYNNIEGVMDFALEELFGKEFVEYVEWIHSETVEQWGVDYMRRVDRLKKGECLLYITDSLDALDSEAAKKRFEESMKDKEEKGSYKTEKAKYLSSSFFSQLCRIMKGKDATHIIVSQLRDKIGVTFGERKVRAGGKAMNYYCHQVVWLAVIKKIPKKKRIVGVNIRARFKKNKCSKPFREAEFPIIFDYGIDDITSMTEYLNYSKEAPKQVEDGGKEAMKELINSVQKQWDREEEDAKTKRKKKYG